MTPRGALGIVASGKRNVAVDPIDSLTGYRVLLKPTDLSAAGTFTDWRDSSPVGRVCVPTSGGTAPTVVAGATPGGNKAVSFTGASFGLDFFGGDSAALWASSQYNETLAAIYAGDADANTYWHSGVQTSSAAQWIAEAANPTTGHVATSCTITCHSSNASGPVDFKVQGSMDKTTWTDIAAYTGTTWTNGQSRTFTANGLSANTTAYKFYRIYVTSAQGDGFLRLSFIDFGIPRPGAWSPVKDGTFAALLKSDTNGTNNGPSLIGNSGSSSHYPYGGTIYEDAGNISRFNFAPVVDVSLWRRYVITVGTTGGVTTWTAYLDGVQRYQTTLGSTAYRYWRPNIRIGTSQNGVWAGRYGALAVLDHAASSSERTVLDNWLASL